MRKSHKNCIMYHKNQLEGKHKFKCRKEFNIIRDGRINSIDLACFRRHPVIDSIGIEAESNLNSNSAQVKSNGEDLKQFKRTYPKSKTFHISCDDELNFDKELVRPNFPRPIRPMIPGRRF